MSISTIQQLAMFGPDSPRREMSVVQARAWCRRLALGHYENFSVLSAVVPRRLRDDFAALYAFCRWADDLGDEAGSRETSLELLAWWRAELEHCFSDAGSPRHPVFIALRPTIRQHDLPIALFDDLIRAFEQDQTVMRYDTWEQLIGYCKLSANPVGRLVLMICSEPRTDELFQSSDAVCTALQLTNHWQDVRRDILERDRIYIPRELISINDFETRLIASAKQGHGVDREFLGESRVVIRQCVQRTWPLFEEGQELLRLLSSDSRPIVWLLAAGGHRVLHLIELWNYETALHRPQLSKATKLILIARAWMASWRRRSSAS